MRKEKVGIISIHYGVNFGSALQAIALSQYLNRILNLNALMLLIIFRNDSKELNRLKNISGHGAKYFMHGLIRMSRFEKTNKKIYILSKRKYLRFKADLFNAGSKG